MENSVGNYTFRQWNPEKEQVGFGEDNGSSTEASCPVTCICCWAVEKVFKTIFQETIDVLIIKSEDSSEKVFDDMDAENEGQTTMFRWISWIMNVLGHFLLFSPIIKLLAWIPLVGGLLSTVLSFAAFIFALVFATCIHFLILSVAWIVYRPLFGLLMLSITVALIGLMQYSP